MLKRFGERLFSFYCHPDFQEDIKGDLEEYYALNLEDKGEKYANRKFFVDVILLFRLSLLRDNWFSRNSIYFAMVKNNLKVAYRSMMRHKFYTFLNLGGLAISITACLLIAIFVKDELSYDRHFENSDQIYRVQSYLKFADNIFDMIATPSPMAAALKQDYPEVEQSGRVRGNFSSLISVNNQFFRQENITYADNSIFDIFSIELLRGNREHLLDEPNTVVINRSTAEKLFGEEDPMGQIIRIEGQDQDLKITGIVEDIRSNTHFHFQMFRTMLDRGDHNQQFWLSNNFVTYIRLNPNTTEEAFESQFEGLVKKYFAEQVQQAVGVSLETALASGNIIDYSLIPLHDIHLHSNKDFELEANGSVQYVYLFSIIGFFILLIACINFMNMATARASIRAKEVGVRKVLGSLRKQLVNQFLTEAILNSLLAFILGIILTYVALPYFNQITNKSLVDPLFGASGLWPYLVVSCLAVGILAGIYPAFVLSSYRPVKVLKGEVTQGKKASWIRSILVVIQFTASIFLIIGSIIVYSQLSYLQNKELGFNKDQVLIVNNAGLLGQNMMSFKNELLRNPNIESVSVSSYIPAANIFNDTPFVREDATTSDEAVSIQYWNVDYDYAKTLGLQITEGRFFDREFPTDSMGVVVNETAARRFGYDDPIGKKIKPMALNAQQAVSVFTIIGVMKDFHYQSMRTDILPQILMLRPDIGGMSVKFKAAATKEVLEISEELWSEMSGGLPFEFDFLDEMFARSFDNENRIKTIFSVLTVLAILVASLGLFGLAAYVTEQRKKEIGIRKVLGASTIKLLRLLFQKFTVLVFISALLAVPVAYYFASDWLSGFAYAIKLSPVFFIAGALGTLIIAWMTVGYQSLKAATRNPIDNLRVE